MNMKGSTKIYSILALLFIYWICFKILYSKTFHQNVFQTQIPHSSPRVSKMTQRRQWIKDTCQDLGKEIGLFEFRERKGVKTSVRQSINGDNFIRETKTKTIYCFAHKVATSSMFYIYSHIQNDSKFLHEIKMKKKIAFMIKFKLSLPSKDVRRLSSSHYTYLIHRHPYERLISGYLDRIVNNNCSYQAKETYEGVYKKKLNGTCIPKIPSFVQFVRLIIEQERISASYINDHWRPIYNLCSPCLIDFDGIYKMDEIKELLKESGMNKSFWEKIPKFNEKKGSSIQKPIRLYYSKLSCVDLNKLRKVYELDFKLFQYDDTEYFDICQDIHK